MQIPSSTYRVQLHKGFTLKDLQGIVSYLHALGISTVYASPIVTATPGSMHGYDVTDPHFINPEIGTLEDLETLAGMLKEKEISWLQDIVPNHMAFSSFNTRLMDVLERGKRSEYYNYFDINWHHPSAGLYGKLMVPFLGKEFENCIEDGEIQLSFSETGFNVRYFDTQYPFSIPAYDYLITLLKISESPTDLIDDFITFTTFDTCNRNRKEWQSHKNIVIQSLLRMPAKQKAIQAVLSEVNQDKKKLKEFLKTQYYTLTFWKSTENEINYRRFFTVNTLICLRMEEESVFQEYHSFLYSLYKKEIIHGFRIDHIDGLRDPAGYVNRLRALSGECCYIIAEKILEAREEMPTQWPLQGTSGYEFLSYVNQLFTSRKGAKDLSSFYRQLIPNLPSYKKLVLENKKLILEKYMAGEWENLVQYLVELKLQNGFEREKLKEALSQLMLALPVYRIYFNRLPLQGKNLRIIQETVEKAKQVSNSCWPEIDYLQSLLTSPPQDEDKHYRALLFFQRLMQFTGPLTAKGVEDTTFYVYNPLISHDEVGDTPSTLGITIQDFHAKMQSRRQSTPLSLNATATHDTKRGEDARMRLDVLSELALEWEHHVQKWFNMNHNFRRIKNGKPAPTINDEYFIYQSMVGGFPEDFIVTKEWIQRVQAYLTKALREAKINTNWEAPVEGYEKTCLVFIEQILQKEHGFLSDFLPFVKKVCSYAHSYALGQTLIKITAPGIPDTYQGCELWDLSYVDPDNRRPVDYAKRNEGLQQIIQKEKEGRISLFSFLKAHRGEGLEKLFVTWKALNFRKSCPDLFTKGAYIALPLTGEANLAIAYARQYAASWVIVLVPLGIVKKNEASSDTGNPWDGHYVTLPGEAPHTWINVFTRESLSIDNQQLSLQHVFKTFAPALLVSEKV